jgi:hypothetical protein
MVGRRGRLRSAAWFEFQDGEHGSLEVELVLRRHERKHTYHAIHLIDEFPLQTRHDIRRHADVRDVISGNENHVSNHSVEVPKGRAAVHIRDEGELISRDPAATLALSTRFSRVDCDFGDSVLDDGGLRVLRSRGCENIGAHEADHQHDKSQEEPELVEGGE